MGQIAAELSVAQRLGQLLDRGLLPAGGPAEAAERLIERLERPARVALLGLPGSGKSAILNLLTGAVVVPETLRLPTIIVQQGVEPRMLCTLTDGRTEIVPGIDLNDVLSLNPALVTLEMDLPALKVISLLEVSAGPIEAEQRRAAIWASKRADILIWCTTSYLPKEQQVWEGMPDVVKDNGFLFLTKVDLLGSHEAAAGMLERVEERAGEEFRQVLSISARQARAATRPGEPMNRDLFRESGAAAVITTIKSRVQAARRADTDTAELLLARHVETGGVDARRFADVESAPAPVTEPAPQRIPPPDTPIAAPAVVKAEAEPVELPVEKQELTPDIRDAAGQPVEPDPVLDLVPMVVEDEPEQIAAPDRDPAPMPVPPPVHVRSAEPTFARMPTPEPESRVGDSRRRFSDRIKQLPIPNDVLSVPLRSTWKSKAETAAARTSAPEPEAVQPEAPHLERQDAGENSRSPRDEPRARQDAVKQPQPQDDEAMLARMVANVTQPEPEAGEDDSIPEGGDQVGGEETAVADDSPRRAERLNPAEPDATAERSPRAQLFGSRKPAVAADQPPRATPVGRPTEPVTRVRAPTPRPLEPPRPATLSAEGLATPPIMAIRDRPHAGLDAADPRWIERRERPRITTCTGAAATPSVDTTPAATPSAEKEVVDGAIWHIMARSVDLSVMVDPEDKIPVDMILEHSRETIEQVIALLGSAQSSGLRRIMADLGEIQDIIALMQLEKGHAPADDALTLLLQIRRDLETLRAA